MKSAGSTKSVESQEARVARTVDGGIQGWSDSLPYALWRANAAAQKLLIDSIADLGVTINQLGLAVHLEEYGSLSASDLARHLRITPQSVSAALNQLEEKGWVTRRPHPVHGRVIWYELTERGAAVTAEGRKKLAAVDATLARVLGAERQQELIRSLRDLFVGLDGPDVASGPLWRVF